MTQPLKKPLDAPWGDAEQIRSLTFDSVRDLEEAGERCLGDLMSVLPEMGTGDEAEC
jgi:hypothetical protein